MKHFAGLCISGPLDGQLSEQEQPKFRVIQNGSLGGIFAIMEWVYVWHETAEGIHFWALEGATPKSILTKLATRYMETADLYSDEA